MADIKMNDDMLEKKNNFFKDALMSVPCSVSTSFKKEH